MAVSCVIVDDSEAFLASAKRLLETQGMLVLGVATSGDEAVRMVERLAPDVALVDIELGDEDGIELAHRLAALAPGTRTVLISAHDSEHVREPIARSPAVGFVPKTALGADAVAGLLV